MSIKNRVRRRRILEAHLKKKIRGKLHSKSVKKKNVWVTNKYT